MHKKYFWSLDCDAQNVFFHQHQGQENFGNHSSNAHTGTISTQACSPILRTHGELAKNADSSKNVQFTMRVC